MAKTTAMSKSSILLSLLFLLAISADALVLPNRAVARASCAPRGKPRFMNDALVGAAPDDVKSSKKMQLASQIRKEGGLFAFNTKFGALNPYALWYGVTSIVLGLFWFVALIGCELLYKVTNGKVDKLKRLPTFFSQIWGETLIKVARVQPEVVGRDALKTFFER